MDVWSVFVSNIKGSRMKCLGTPVELVALKKADITQFIRLAYLFRKMPSHTHLTCVELETKSFGK